MKFEKPRVFERTLDCGCVMQLRYENNEPAHPVIVSPCATAKANTIHPTLWSLQMVENLNAWREITPAPEPVKPERTPFPSQPELDAIVGRKRRELINENIGLKIELRGKAAETTRLCDEINRANETIAELRRELTEYKGSHQWYVQETSGLNTQVAGQRRNIEKLLAERGDVADANATIAELRQKVAELEANYRPKFKWHCTGCGVTSDKFATEAERNNSKDIHARECKHNLKTDNLLAELRDQLTKAWMRGDLKTADRIADLIGDRRPSEHESDGAK
jgi:hypothetical protein